MSDSVVQDDLQRFADVALDLPGQDTYTYAVPPEMSELRPGDGVEVPLGRRRVAGYVVSIHNNKPKAFTVKVIAKHKQHLSLPDALVQLVRWSARYYRCSFGQFLAGVIPAAARKGVQAREQRWLTKVEVAPEGLTKRQTQIFQNLSPGPYTLAQAAEEAGAAASTLQRMLEQGCFHQRTERIASEHKFLHHEREDHPLTQEQQVAVDAIHDNMGRDEIKPYLLYGVTGSGKTRVYMELAEEQIEQGKQVLLLLPEIALTPQLAARFRNHFERVALWHSALSAGERFVQWQAVQAGEIDLIIGTRSSLFAPFKNLGLIIVDEEHDSSYKQDSQPRYHGRDLAVVYARQLGIPLILGSATPSCETIANVRAKKYLVGTLKERPAGALLPEAFTVDMREECKKQQRAAILSERLIDELERMKARGEQAIIFLNRRGWSPVIQCKACGEAVECPRCAIPLTWHKGKKLLRCHYCDFEQKLPEICPSCKEPALSSKGVGTEQLCAQLEEAVPNLKTLRLDADTVAEAQGHAKIVEEFASGSVDCLVGTQMVAKGLHFPKVTLVGVVAADQGLYAPDFRAAERTFQLIAQVAGRAGRGERPGRIILQAYDPEAEAITCAIENRPRRFYDAELALRAEYAYPPSSGLVRFVWRGDRKDQVEKVAAEHGERIRRHLDGAVLLGPNPAAIEQLNNQFRYHAMLKATSRHAAQMVLNHVDAEAPLKSSKAVHVVIDVDPYSFS